MTDDIDRPRWDYRVTVTGVPRGKNILLTNIGKARDSAASLLSATPPVYYPQVPAKE
ncbi:MAG: hypothetical protein ACPL7K_04445 [Armatimonadota bacterium]